MTTAEKLGLPPRTFFYHFDQVATMLNVKESDLRRRYIYYIGVTPGPPRRDLIAATNIAPEGGEPEWRVAEDHLKRWLRFKGLRFFSRGFV